MTEQDRRPKETEKASTDEKIEPKKNTGQKDKKKKIDPLNEIKEALEESKLEAKDNYDRFLRVSAEFENYKKRSARQMEDFKKYANESLIMELLNVVDNLERALHSSGNENNSTNSVAEGVQMTLSEILKIIEKFGVKPIESIEQAFDPNFHEAVMQEEADGYPEQTVLKELQKGYLIHDRLLRPAMVVVSKQAPGATSNNE